MNVLNDRLPRTLFALLVSSVLFSLLLHFTANGSRAQNAPPPVAAPTVHAAGPFVQLHVAPSFTDLSFTNLSFTDLTQATTVEDQIHVSNPVVSPDAHYAAVTVVPLGAETAHLARTQLYDLKTGRMQATVPGYTPRWLDGGTALQVETKNRSLALYPISAMLVPSGTVLTPVTDTGVANSTGPLDEPTVAPVDLRMATYPTTIRVAHHPSNGCRAVPDWQVDTIPFEEYVARVVPAETPSWWPVDALAAQAVAARTYAWQKILAGRADYDVTDWANFQMMCDDRYPNS
ncbi:MAG TPA: SpoIID/LytB domain-containing protein, partial [Caldilineaceae bacterium]|nr:SpoIID/LytB domain-containing protein [Caldilineaceae bacterium]